MIILEVGGTCLGLVDFLVGRMGSEEMSEGEADKGLAESDVEALDRSNIGKSETLVVGEAGIAGSEWEESVDKGLTKAWSCGSYEQVCGMCDKETAWSTKVKSEEGGCVIEWGEKNGKIFSWKTTSLETKNCSVWTLKSLYPLVPKGYPTKTQGIDLASNLVIWEDKVEA